MINYSDKERIIELFNKGYGSRKIAKELNCGRKAIRIFFKKNLLRHQPTQKLNAEDFWNKMDKSNSDGCWVWSGIVDYKGYGKIKFNNKRYKTHRLAYILTNGEICDNLLVCHKCDNPPCCNPDHLFLGTNQDNIIDCLKKDRQTASKLKTSDIASIRKLREEGHDAKVIANLFNVTPQAIREVLNGKRWYYIK
jgi:hypothetical protein